MKEELIVGMGVLQHLVRVVQEGDSASFVAARTVPRLVWRQEFMVIPLSGDWKAEREALLPLSERHPGQRWGHQD